jgi:CHASE1-domain containing sensor protein
MPAGRVESSPPPTARRLRYLAVILPALFGVVASIGLFLMVGSWEYRVDGIDFENQARDRLNIMAGDFKDSSDLLYAIRAYIGSADGPVSRTEYARFSATLHGDVVSLRDIGWAPRVTLARRAAFEREMRASGLPDFEITERDSAGNAIRAGDRPEDFPIVLTEGVSDPRRVVGLDVAFEPVRRSAVHRTIETGQPASTPPIRLATGTGTRDGLVSVLALGVGTDAGGAPAIRGVVLGAFNIVAMIDNIVSAKAILTDLDVYFFEPGATPDDAANYQRQSRPTGAPGATQRVLLARRYWSGTVSIMDQQWTAMFVPAAASQRMSWHWQTAMPLLIG